MILAPGDAIDMNGTRLMVVALFDHQKKENCYKVLWVSVFEENVTIKQSAETLETLQLIGQCKI